MTVRGSFAVTLLVVLLVSLAANLMIAGFLASRVVGLGPGSDQIDRIVSLGIHDFPPEIQRDILDQVRVRRVELDDNISAVQAAEQRMFQAMRADPPDRMALEASFADVRSTTNGVQAIGQGIVAHAIVRSPPDVRARIRERGGILP